MKTTFNLILAWFLRGLVKTVGKVLYRLHVSGVGHIPKNGGALLVANHVSYLDFILIVSSVPRHVSFIMNADIYKKPSLKWLLQGLNCIPISPRGGGNNFDEFNKTVAFHIGQGRIVMIFAEGTVSRTGQVLEFKKGIEHLSTLTNAPVIPIHLHNVQGTPFSFRAGSGKMEKFSFRSLRREVLVNIGAALSGNVTAFELRQKIKEMEVENFNHLTKKFQPIDKMLNEYLFKASEGCWKIGDSKIPFNTIKSRLSQISTALSQLLTEDERIGILLPKNEDALLLNLWLLQNNKTIVNIDPEFSNEERYYVLKKAKVKTLITTMDLEFSRFSPNAERIIYTEHLHEAIEKGITTNIICKQINRLGRKVLSAFQTSKGLDEPVAIIFQRKKNEEIRCVSLSHRNLLSVLQGLRQVYYFRRGSSMMSNLPLHQSYGFVVEFLLPLIYDLRVEVVDDRINPDAFIKKLSQSQPSLVIATPNQLEAIAELSQIKNIPYLTHVFTADLHPNHRHIGLLCERGIAVYVCAGMNETSSVFAVNLVNYSGKDIAGKVMEQENFQDGTIGKPLPGIAAKICDDTFNELACCEMGTLWIKGGCIATEAENSNDCIRELRNGWFNTRLQGSIDQRGFIHL